jgi:hypothetical protein
MVGLFVPSFRFPKPQDPDDMQDKLDLALARLWEEGCPLAHPSARSQMIVLGLRRWRSFERRNTHKRPTLDDRVEDLAVGLRDAFEPERKLVGPMMQHYRCIAKAMATVLAPPHLTT